MALTLGTLTAPHFLIPGLRTGSRALTSPWSSQEPLVSGKKIQFMSEKAGSTALPSEMEKVWTGDRN